MGATTYCGNQERCGPTSWGFRARRPILSTGCYAPLGQFRSFTLLFVTYGQERIENIRHAVADLPAELHPYYHFATFEEAKADFLGPVWKSRSSGDEERYMLVRH